MDVSNILLGVVSIVMLIEGAVHTIFPGKTRKMMIKMYKNDMLVKEIGLIEIIAALAIMLVIVLI